MHPNSMTPARAIRTTIFAALGGALATSLAVISGGERFWWIVIPVSVVLFIPVFRYYWYPLIMGSPNSGD